MALINPNSNEKQKKDVLYCRVSKELMEEIKAYCKFAGFNTITPFVIKAIEFIFEQDKEWQKKQTRNKSNR